MRNLKACCTKLSGEHLVSRAVLTVLGHKGIQISGPPWLNGRTKVLPFSALKTNCLCRVHNSALSPLDEAAAKFFLAFKQCSTGNIGPSQNYLLSGHDLERWLLKTAAALIASGNLIEGRSQIEGALAEKTEVVDLLEEISAWRFPLGLYAIQDHGARFTRRDYFELAPMLKPDTDKLTAIVSDIQGLHISLLVSDFPPEWVGFKSAVYRPGKLVFDFGHVCHNIQLSWQDNALHEDIVMNWLRPASTDTLW